VSKSLDSLGEVRALRSQIREAGLRGTGARIAVLRLLSGSDVPLSHQEVSERIVGAGYDHATVYRNLVDLTEAGLLNRTDLGDRIWRFELRRDEGDHKTKHPHFLCTTCGTVACLPDRSVSVRRSRGMPKAFSGRRLIVQIQGRCDNCERQKAAG
jgi:Fur family ferric uptake transcriptional regulator